MKNYILIHNYCHANAIQEQLDEIVANGQMTENTRLFFSAGNCLTGRDLAKLVGNFEITTDVEFDNENVIYIPKKHYLERLAREREKA